MDFEKTFSINESYICLYRRFDEAKPEKSTPTFSVSVLFKCIT